MDTLTASELRFERRLDAPIDMVWQYIVDPELRARWFMGGPTDLRPGGSIGMTMNHPALSDEDVPTPDKYAGAVGRSWSEEILRVEPPHLLVFTWDNGASGEVTIELSEAGDGTTLSLVHRGIPTRDKAVNFGGGWGAHLSALERRVRGAGVPDFWALFDQAAATANAEIA